MFQNKANKKRIFLFVVVSVFLVFTNVSAEIISAELVNVENKETKTLEKKILYGEISKEIEGRDIISENVEKVGENYRIYSGRPQFYKQDEKWFSVDYRLDIVPPLKTGFIKTAYASTLPPVFDGYCYNAGGTDFATTRISVFATTCNTGGTSFKVEAYGNAGTFGISRSFLNFDRSALAGVISSASLNLYPSAVGNYVVVVETSPVSNYNLSAGDYYAEGFSRNSLENPTRLTTPVILNNTVYNGLLFNAAGLSYLNSEGNIINLGLHEVVHDVEGVAAYGFFTSTIYSSEEAGTSKDPYLEVEMTAATPTPSSTPSSGSFPSELTIDYPILDLGLGLFLFFFIFFAVIFYFKKSKTVLSNKK